MGRSARQPRGAPGWSRGRGGRCPAEPRVPPSCWCPGRAWQSSPGAALLDAHISRHPARRGGEGKVYAVGIEAGCAVATSGLSCGGGSTCPAWARRGLGRASRLCPAALALLWHAKAGAFVRHSPAVCGQPRHSGRWPWPGGWHRGTAGLPDADAGSEPPTQERKALGSVLLLPPPPLPLPSHGRDAPAGTGDGLGVTPTRRSWDRDLTELQGLRFTG